MLDNKSYCQIPHVKVSMRIMYGYASGPRYIKRTERIRVLPPGECLSLGGFFNMVDNKSSFLLYFMNKSIILSHNRQIICGRARKMPIFIKYVVEKAQSLNRTSRNFVLSLVIGMTFCLLLLQQFLQ